ncbi:MAG: hypothetical protein R6W70_05275, partial [bacterium]
MLLAVFHGDFPSDFCGFRETPPDPDLECEYSERFDMPCYNRVVQEHAWDFYQEWTGPDFPRMLIIQIQHPTPYFDDSYAVNSANMGPYGDAITHELIPRIEERFRGIGEGWRENVDLRHILERDWAILGPKLEGKIHIYVVE